VGNVSFDLNQNETLGIVGESGSGKTVLSRTVMGLQPRTNVTVTGSVLLNGFEVVGCQRRGETEDMGLQVAMIFQDPMTSLKSRDAYRQADRRDSPGSPGYGPLGRQGPGH